MHNASFTVKTPLRDAQRQFGQDNPDRTAKESIGFNAVTIEEIFG